MRMRRKKNLEERLAACSDYLIECVNEDLNYENAEKETKLLDFESLFGNTNRVMLEVGCGKGSFACTYAKENPDVNIIAVERASNVIVTACETAKDLGLSNIKFMKCTAEYLPSYIPQNSISEINLNFSCPFPKAKYAKHRLTHKQFLDIYKKIMKSDAVIYQKTDNMHFFEFSIESLSQNGFKLSNISLDLHNSDFEGNIVTEYEKRFSDQGFPIYRLEARMQEKRGC
ncbi:MAG: tRNA (guanosine(46)-N7)-methyltransferase TrmB [Clostridiales bacterium]|nr:tRNA (guanosine(46)-N7)-methyltransferase TrmB [Clostridiales bacterium]